MRNSRIDLSREQTVVVAIVTVLVSVGAVWLMASIFVNGTAPTSTTATTAPPPADTTTTAIETTTTDSETTTTDSETTTTSDPVTTATVGVFDEVAAVEVFVEEFAGAIAGGDSEFLFERLHPAVKATYEEEACLAHIDDGVLPLEDYRQVGPVVGPFDSEFGEFPITSYEARVAFEIGDEPMETTAVFSLTEGVVRWFAECS